MSVASVFFSRRRTSAPGVKSVVKVSTKQKNLQELCEQSQTKFIMTSSGKSKTEKRDTR